MAQSEFSTFYYGIKIGSTNQYLNFTENGGAEIAAQIEPGSYSLTDLLLAIKTALDAASTLPQEYTVTLDRDTRQITISADVTFDLLLNTGAQLGSSAWALMGYDQGVDLTGLLTYTGGGGAGEIYTTQFTLQDFIDAEDYQERIDAAINEAASGEIEVISFGTRKFFDMSFKFITSIVPQDGKVIRSNATGREDARQFFSTIIDKGPFEFMPSDQDRSVFYKVLLEKTGSSSTGTGFKFKELTDRNLPGYFDVNNIRLRVVE